MIVLTGEILIDLIGSNPLEAAMLSYRGVLGGSALNTASILSRLGLPTRFLGEVGGDRLGLWAKRRIEERGIDARYLQSLPLPSPLALAELDAQGNASYTFYRLFEAPFQPDLTALEGVGWFHFGSLSAFEPRTQAGLRALLQACRERGVAVSFDPNFRSPLSPGLRKALELYQPYLDLIKASYEDARLLFGPLAPEEALIALSQLGGQLTLLTLGSEGALAFFRGEVLQIPAPRVSVVDTIGAGDTFTAATLYGLWHAQVRSRADLVAWPGHQLREILERAAVLAAQACTVPGANLPPEIILNWQRT
jgi:fructokinase